MKQYSISLPSHNTVSHCVIDDPWVSYSVGGYAVCDSQKVVPISHMPNHNDGMAFVLDLVEDAPIRDHLHGEIAEKIEELQMLQPW